MAGEKVVLEEVLKQHKEGRAPNLTVSEFFEVFSVDQILKDFDMSYENILDGIFDGSNDGGIDWAYVLLNGSVVNFGEEVLLPERGDLEISLHVGQSKNEDNFKETPIDRLKSRLEVLLNFDADVIALAAVKNELVEFFSNFKNLYLRAAGRFPTLSIHLYITPQRVTHRRRELSSVC